jgi:hypothetical protein
MSRRRDVAVRVVRITRSSRRGELQALANRHPFHRRWEESRWDRGDGPFAFDLLDDVSEVVAVSQL